jgi:26S proteasome non-ATPase regulatory subunit 9
MNSEKDAYEELALKKEEIENRLTELNQILFQEGNVGMHEELVDRDGYPRADIDLFKVRQTRQEINCLQNDHKALMKQIEKELNKKYINMKNEEKFGEESFHQIKNNNNNNNNNNSSNGNHKHLKPFLKITHVDENSPSHEAGLKKDDLIVQFGPHRHSNTDKITLTLIADHVQSHVNKIILLNVLRKESQNDLNPQYVKIKLFPKAWSGHGVLGCKLITLE